MASAQSEDDRPVTGFAWSENADWINFEPGFTMATAHVNHLSGFVWSDSVGWIKLGADNDGPYANTNAVNWGVNRSPAGFLSGFAWSENAGWICFDPGFGGVRINPANGRFEGFAWSDSLGWIHLSNDALGYGADTEPLPVAVPALDAAALVLLILLMLAVARHSSLLNGVDKQGAST
ncbi:MAG: hypothetical protein Tsb002_34360 [Wenzhouxiangellaceae bacterium]